MRGGCCQPAGPNVPQVLGAFFGFRFLMPLTCSRLLLAAGLRTGRLDGSFCRWREGCRRRLGRETRCWYGCFLHPIHPVRCCDGHWRDLLWATCRQCSSRSSSPVAAPPVLAMGSLHCGPAVCMGGGPALSLARVSRSLPGLSGATGLSPAGPAAACAPPHTHSAVSRVVGAWRQGRVAV